MANPPVVQEGKKQESFFLRAARILHEHPYIFRTVMASAAAVSGAFTGGLGAAAIGVAWVAIENAANAAIENELKIAKNEMSGHIKANDEKTREIEIQDIAYKLEVGAQDKNLSQEKMQELVEKMEQKLAVNNDKPIVDMTESENKKNDNDANHQPSIVHAHHKKSEAKSVEPQNQEANKPIGPHAAKVLEKQNSNGGAARAA